MIKQQKLNKSKRKFKIASRINPPTCN